MKIPSKLKIGGHTVKVVIMSLPDGTDGEYDTSKLQISIDEALPQSMRESTLIHEIFHALNGTYDGDTVGHSLLDSLSEQFYQVLKDNDLLK